MTIESGMLHAESLLFGQQERNYLKQSSKLSQSLEMFLQTTKHDLFSVLTSRTNPVKRKGIIQRSNGAQHRAPIQYGYRDRIRRINGKKRHLMTPELPLMQMLQNFKTRIERLPISLAATGGKPGDSPEQHAEPHRYNRYLLTTDIQNAFPSIDSARVYTVLQSALEASLSNRFPGLSGYEQDLFVRCLVFLSVYKDQLPQGSPISPTLLNLVMAETDRQILAYLANSPQYINPVYTRYIDDLGVSFSHFASYELLQRELQKRYQAFSIYFDQSEYYTQSLETDTWMQRHVPRTFLDQSHLPMTKDELVTLSQTNNQLAHYLFPGDQPMSLFSLQDTFQSHVDVLGEISHQIHHLFSQDYSFSDTQESKLFFDFIAYIEKRLVTQREYYAIQSADKIDSHYADKLYKYFYALIGELHKFKQHLFIDSAGKTMSTLKSGVFIILSEHGWTANIDKTNERNPSSSKVREITKITFNEHGERGVASSKLKQYYEYFVELAYISEEAFLRDKKFRQFVDKGTINHGSLLKSLHGMANYLNRIYEGRKRPRRMRQLYKKALDRRQESPTEYDNAWNSLFVNLAVEDMVTEESQELSFQENLETEERLTESERLWLGESANEYPELASGDNVHQSEEEREFGERMSTRYS